MYKISKNLSYVKLNMFVYIFNLETKEEFYLENDAVAIWSLLEDATSDVCLRDRIKSLCKNEQIEKECYSFLSQLHDLGILER